MKNRMGFAVFAMATCVWTGAFAADSVRLMSYNIRHGAGMDNRFDLGRTAAAIVREKPAFVGLQEIDQLTKRVGGTNTCEVLAKLTGLTATFARAIPFDGGEYGVAVLSRETPKSVKRIPLPGGEPRILLLCEFGDCWFGTTHLAVDSEKARTDSIAIIRQAVADCGTKPVFLTGDWNSLPDSSVLKGLKGFLSVLSREDQPTFNDKRNMCIDYVAVDAAHRASLAICERRVVADTTTSDHRPLVVEVMPAIAALVPAPKKVVTGAGSLAYPVGAAPIAMKTDAALPAEGYVLDVTKDGIVITSADAAGLQHAKATLAQLEAAEDGTVRVPAVRIEDAPAYRWRGVHLDVCRHFFGVAEIKRIMDVMAEYKFNVFHWHLTDDQGWRLELPGFPELIEKGAARPSSPCRWNPKRQDGRTYGPYYFTAADVAEVLAYAKARQIRVVPEIELPGHAAALVAAHPEFYCQVTNAVPTTPWTSWGVTPDVLCAGNDAVLRFYERILDEVVKMFPDEVVHIGGDECPKRNWNACPRCQAKMKREGLKNADELQSALTRHFVTYLAKKGRRALGWDEILEGGLPAGAMVMSWRGMEGGIKAAKAGHEVVMTPWQHCYLDWAQGLANDRYEYIWGNVTFENSYAFDPVAGIPPEFHKYVLGGQANNWTEYTQDDAELEYKMLPRLLAISEALWTAPATRDYKAFAGRLGPRVEDLKRRGYAVAPVPESFAEYKPR